MFLCCFLIFIFSGRGKQCTCVDVTGQLVLGVVNLEAREMAQWF